MNANESLCQFLYKLYSQFAPTGGLKKAVMIAMARYK